MDIRILVKFKAAMIIPVSIYPMAEGDLEIIVLYLAGCPKGGKKYTRGLIGPCVPP